MPSKIRCTANHRHDGATHWKPETKKTVDSSNACVCLYKSKKTSNRWTSDLAVGL